MKDTQRIGRKYEVQKPGRMKKHYPTPEERREALQQQREAWNELRDMWQATTEELEEERKNAVVEVFKGEDPAKLPRWAYIVAVALGVVAGLLMAWGIAYVLVLIASLV